MAAGYELSVEAFVEGVRVVLLHQRALKEGKIASGLLHSCSLALSSFLKVHNGYTCLGLSKGWQRSLTPRVLPLFPGRLTALSRRPPWLLVKVSSFVVCVPPLPRFIAEGRWVSWLGR